MPRYRGDVEQARRDLRAMGNTPAQARKYAPRAAEMRQQAADRETPPYSWLGGPGMPERSERDEEDR